MLFHFLPNGAVSRFVQDYHERQGADAFAFRARLRNRKRRGTIFDVVGLEDVAALCASEMCFSSYHSFQFSVFSYQFSVYSPPITIHPSPF